jgi:hypothetical protein
VSPLLSSLFNILLLFCSLSCLWLSFVDFTRQSSHQSPVHTWGHHITKSYWLRMRSGLGFISILDRRNILLGESQGENGTYLARSNVLLCQHRPNGLVSKGWVPRTKRPHLMYPCKQVTEAKRKAQPTCGCMGLHWIFHFPSAMWLSCFSSLSFISLLCHLFPCIIRTQPVCFFSGPPPFYIITPFDARTWLGSKSITLI